MQVEHKWKPSERLLRLAERQHVVISNEQHILYRDTRKLQDAWRDVVYTYNIPASISNTLLRGMNDTVNSPPLDRRTNSMMSNVAFGQLSVGEFWEGLKQDRWIIRNFGVRSRAYLLALVEVS